MTIAHPGIERVDRFVAEGEYGIADLLEAWRACAAVICAFHGITARELLEAELAQARGLDADASENAREFVRASLVAETEIRAGALAGWER